MSPDVDDLTGTVEEDKAVEPHPPWGESLSVDERLIVSPASGLFVPAPEGEGVAAGGRFLEIGSVIGYVAGTPVESAFRGWCMDMFVLPGERVFRGEALAWLRTA